MRLKDLADKQQSKQVQVKKEEQVKNKDEENLISIEDFAKIQFRIAEVWRLKKSKEPISC